MLKFCNINNSSDEDFVDLEFDIINVKKKLFGNLYIECAASYNDTTNVGFALELKKGMVGRFDKNPATFKSYLDGIKLIYIENLSDLFIKVMSNLYNRKELENLKLKKINYIECGILEGDLRNITNEVVKFKCFLDSSQRQNLYSEFYINIDLKNKKLYINEKSSEYRNNIIKYLCEG